MVNAFIQKSASCRHVVKGTHSFQSQLAVKCTYHNVKRQHLAAIFSEHFRGFYGSLDPLFVTYDSSHSEIHFVMVSAACLKEHSSRLYE